MVWEPSVSHVTSQPPPKPVEDMWMLKRYGDHKLTKKMWGPPVFRKHCFRPLTSGPASWWGLSTVTNLWSSVMDRTSNSFSLPKMSNQSFFRGSPELVSSRRSRLWSLSTMETSWARKGTTAAWTRFHRVCLSRVRTVLHVDIRTL